ncbi:methionine synthase [Alistipes sp. OttesenSCG-928-B03]|nr:methionine synthase [Alistipes sp. OttesenSCG-928-B03]
MSKTIYDILRERVMVLDGALGTMVQGYGLGEDDFRGERFAQWEVLLAGCNDVLVLTRPDVISGIHEAYLRAGADIISTDTFNSQAVSLADYRLGDYAYEINREAAAIARKAADEATRSNPAKPRFVAGSMGPTGSTASMSADVNDPGARGVTFDELVAAYGDQVRGLLDGGVDTLLIETIFDTLNAKAAAFAIERECAERGVRIPVMLSGTLADASGRTLSGQTVEAFYTSLEHARPLSIGFNCAYGAKQLRPYLARLAGVAGFAVSAHPNAGLPNLMGGYDETPEMMAADVEEYLREGLVNIIGGCCGTTPEHIRCIAEVAARYSPRPLPAPRHETVLSGLEPLRITPETNFVNIGERANVAGSAKFARLVREGAWDEAVAIARQQVEAGAQVVDVCMDDGLIEGVAAMTRFLNLASAEPEIARVPFMIDSSSWEVLEAGLKCVQGKSIVNSISLKEGEEEFVRRARAVMAYGAAAVVMLFDERGQADTFDRKIEVAQRAYNILTQIGFPPEDIVFDPNILAVATGIEEHDSYAVDFIEAVRWIKANLPHAKVSGGVSNLSFAFRGNNTVREAMHSVFLYHAIAAGMDMGIVNPALLQVYTDIEPELLELAEDVVLNRRADATDRLSAYAERVKGDPARQADPAVQKWRSGTVAERLAYAMMKGVAGFVEADVEEAYHEAGSPLAVIDGMLMPAMTTVGELFADGKMFLPQVVKSARVMRRAVAVLTPYMEQSAGERPAAGKILIATVKGDVHDIGKNIVSVVMSCNGYDVTDLGVMVECERIADEAQRTGADIVGLSGLISPSLDEMTKVAAEFERRGMTVPIIIGGATTSELHTAVKIAPAYSGAVIHSNDASENITILNRLFGQGREIYIEEVRRRQAELRDRYEKRGAEVLLTLAEARANRFVKATADVVAPRSTGRQVLTDFAIADVADYIDWNFFFPAWGIRGRFPELLDNKNKGEEARKLFADAQAMLTRIADEKLLTLNAVYGIYKAERDGDDIVLHDGGRVFRLAQLRNQEAGQERNLSLADFVADGGDYVGAFAVTAGIGLTQMTEKFRTAGDEYSAIMCKLLADRLTEAFAEVVHTHIRREAWGYETTPLTPAQVIGGSYQGVRMAFGYPACPDHSLKRDVFELLDATAATGMEITENYMIRPGEALCGVIFAGPEARYFNLGRIDAEQLDDYARRRGMPPAEIARLIPHNI